MNREDAAARGKLWPPRLGKLVQQRPQRERLGGWGRVTGQGEQVLHGLLQALGSLHGGGDRAAQVGSPPNPTWRSAGQP
jgi:hypothetical protein